MAKFFQVLQSNLLSDIYFLSTRTKNCKMLISASNLLKIDFKNKNIYIFSTKNILKNNFYRSRKHHLDSALAIIYNFPHMRMPFSSSQFLFGQRVYMHIILQGGVPKLEYW